MVRILDIWNLVLGGAQLYFSKSYPWVKQNFPNNPFSTDGEGNGYPLQYSGPENSMGCIVLYSPWVAKSQTQLSDFHFHNQEELQIRKNKKQIRKNSQYTDA